MKTGTLVHIETGTEYYNEGTFFNPSGEEKLLWSLFGPPKEIEIINSTFETVIDEITGFSKREVEAKVNDNFKSGLYNFLPPMGINHNIVLRF